MADTVQSQLDQFQFFADAMVQKLGRYLRVLGFNTIIANSGWSDNFILDELKSTFRILLTRDSQLAERTRLARSPKKNSKVKEMDFVLYLTSEDLEQQMMSVLNYINITPQNFIDMQRNNTLKTRCSKCNGELCETLKENIKNRISPGTAAHYNQYWECNDCHQIYWFGSHWKDIVETLERVNALWISNC